MIVRKKKKVILSKDQIKNTLLRHVFFTSFRSKGRRQFMLLKKKRYLHVGFINKLKKKASKYLLYKSLHLSLNKVFNYKDYLPVIKIINNKKSVLSIFDLFYYNNLLNTKNYVPILLSKFEYNLYDRNHRFLNIFNYFNIKNYNRLYLQSYNYIVYNNFYFLNLYLNIKNNLYIDLKSVISNCYLYLNTKNINNIFSIFKILRNTKFKYVKFSLNNYIKFKNELNVKNVRLLDKYLIKNKMFRSGKFFYNFLEYMKSFTYSVYRNNLFFRKYKYIKFDGNKHNVKLITFNADRLIRLKG
jgi:hypothetical protein